MFPQVNNANSGGGRPPLVTFKAGKMTTEEKPNGKLLVTPETRKGQISLVRGNDNLIYFQWKDRVSGNVVDDFVLFPDDAKFIKVDTGRQGDRVYLLQYKSTPRRFFYWMQDKKSDKDESNAAKLQEYMNNPPQANEPTAGSGGASGQLDQNALLQMLGAFGGGNAGGTNSGGGSGNTGSNSSSVQMSDLQNILQNMGLPSTSSSSAGASGTTSGTSSSTAPASNTPAPAPSSQPARTAEEETEEEMLRRAIEESMKDAEGDNSEDTTQSPAQPPSPTQAAIPPQGATGGITTDDLQRAMAMFQNQGQLGPRVSLAAVLSPENIEGMLADESIRSHLLQHLPEERQTMEELYSTVRSPQLRQGIGALAAALQNGNFNAVLSNFGLSHEASAEKLNMGDFIGAFLAAVQDWGNRNR